MGPETGGRGLEYISPGELARELGVTLPTARVAIAASGKGISGARCPCCGSALRGRWITAEDAADYLASPGVSERYPVVDRSGRLFGMVQERKEGR